MATATTSSRQIPIVCPGHTRPLAELQFISVSPEESFLLSACHDKTPMLRNATTGDWIGSFSGHKGAVWSAKIDPMGYLAATASGDFSVKVWDAISGKVSPLCLFRLSALLIVLICDLPQNVHVLFFFHSDHLL